MLLRHGADPCMCVRGGMSALHLAAVKDVSMVLAMLDLAHTQTQILMQDDEVRPHTHTHTQIGGSDACVSTYGMDFESAQLGAALKDMSCSITSNLLGP